MTKKKYTNLYTEDAKAIILPGRHPCECQASKHKLVNNCQKCGRIVCEQEGSGPCYFCENLVCTKEEEEVLNRGSKKSDVLLDKLMNQVCIKEDLNLQKAITHKETLLKYDKTSAKRTMVIDDQADYFSLEQNTWLNPQQRKVLQEEDSRVHESKFLSKFNQPRSFTIDVENKKIIEGTEKSLEKEQEIYAKLLERTSLPSYSSLQESKQPNHIKSNDNQRDGVDPKIIDCFAIPQFVEVGGQNEGNRPKAKINREDFKFVSRIQDDDFQAAFDQKKCLSMHQPYASLLIYGIKQEEGRDWYTPHRGRLWIASTAKKIEAIEIKDIETFYQQYYENKLGKDEAQKLRYPHTYPNGCLLGCVNIEDCLTQEEYRSREPEGVSDSPYVWLCSDPKKLKFNMPILGQPKIYTLENQMWKAATKNLIQ